MLGALPREGLTGFVRVCREPGPCVAWEGAQGCGEQSRGRIGEERIREWLMGPEFGKEVGEYEGMQVPV